MLYGSGGCSLYDAALLRALGGIDSAYDPAYVEDLDIGYRAWQRGWATVYVAGARLEHRHRTTSSRYYSEEQLDEILEINYLKFLARGVAATPVFLRLWEQALGRLRLRAAWRIALEGGAPEGAEYPEDLLLALCGGDVAVMPGGAAWRKPHTLMAVSKLDQAARGAVLVAFTDRLEPPPAALLAGCAEIVLVRRSAGPLAFRAALQQTLRKWSPETVILEGGEMAQFGSERYFLKGGIANWICPDSPYQARL